MSIGHVQLDRGESGMLEAPVLEDRTESASNHTCKGNSFENSVSNALTVAPPCSALTVVPTMQPTQHQARGRPAADRVSYMSLDAHRFASWCSSDRVQQMPALHLQHVEGAKRIWVKRCTNEYSTNVVPSIT